MKRTRPLLLVGLLASSCAVLTPRDEYAAYRAFRYETDADRRTALGAGYLERYGTGRFAEAVRAEVGTREESFWEERRSTLEGLRAYLESYPNGAHVQEAQARIGVYEAERRRLQAERNAAEQAERERLAAERAANNERVRLFARNTMHYWLRTVGSLDGWGEPFPTLAQRNPDFSTAFGSEPAPQCRGGRCRKSYAINYTVPVPGRTARSETLTLNFDLVSRDRRVLQAALLFPGRGLSRWSEQETQTPFDRADAAQRNQTVQWSMNQLKGIVATAFPEARVTPAELLGPEPEPEGVDDDSAEVAVSATSPIPPQPLGTQWSYVVGCANVTGAQITAPENSRPEGWAEAQGAATAPRSCLRIDAYSAPDIEGVSTNEGLVISWIPPAALQRAPAARPGRPATPARPARPARPAATPAPAR